MCCVLPLLVERGLSQAPWKLAAQCCTMRVRLVFEGMYEDSCLVAWDAGMPVEAAEFLRGTLLMYVSHRLP